MSCKQMQVLLKTDKKDPLVATLVKQKEGESMHAQILR